jgi:hypothetical protein
MKMAAAKAVVAMRHQGRNEREKKENRKPAAWPMKIMAAMKASIMA